jgi:hypothetical protein
MENILELIKVLIGPAIVGYVYYRVYKYESNRE